MTQTQLAVNGAVGRMGQTIRDTATTRDDVSVALGVSPTTDTESDHPIVAPTDRQDALKTRDIDVVVDFSTADAVEPLARDCTATDVALVSGTTGLDEETREVLQAASEEVPVLHATNFSRGVVALQRALDSALAALPSYDIELLETHHSGKQDAPSGTATTLLETVADHRDVASVHGRNGEQQREDGEVGVFSRRAGTVRGEHEILLADNDEALTLTHRAESRGVFAVGALDASHWLAGRLAGRYSVVDVFADTTNGDET
ncbi:4-hydroxy-tetrahydrodipicolinate reductase [Halovenus rubra]|uniref:4-hydroxy-tetrahydrodipicolinate reductase n=2 Tax=Halovenus rubra TaxID=869890 RepID=A0ABD5X730_9EURY|nr:4-hydroxy-tetrahydrodipicolinate reductase [Halovenus rubra]